MKRGMRKSFWKKMESVLCICVMLFGVLGLTGCGNTSQTSADTSNESGNDQSGIADDVAAGEVTWTLDYDGTLTISGNGAMYEDGYSPWMNDENIKRVVIENGITSIGVGAFNECSNLTSIEIPDSVTEIGAGAFSYCSNLTSIDIPDSVTEIGDRAFYFCESLTSIEIPDGVTKIGGDTFYDCVSLTSITIPDSVTEIGERAFMGCDNLTIIGYPGTTAETYAQENEINFVSLEQ